MRYIILLFILISPLELYSLERVIDSLQNVDLVAKDLINDKGERYGVDYYAINRNETHVFVSLEASLKKNVYTSLPPVQFILEENEKVYLGWIMQTDRGEDAKWEVEWSVEAPEMLAQEKMAR